MSEPTMDPLLLTYGTGAATVPSKFVGPVDSVDAEYGWLAANVPQGRVEQQSLIDHGGRMHDVLRVRTPSGLRDYHFDVTDFYAGPNAYANQTPCREGHIGTSSCSHEYARFVHDGRQAFPPSGDASAMLTDTLAAHAPAGHAGAHLPNGQTFTSEQTYAPVAESLSAALLSRYGIVSIDSGVTDRGPTIIAYVNGSGDEARRGLPAYYGGLPVVVRDGGPIEAQGYRPAGDAASDLISGALGPLLRSGALDSTVDRLGNQLIDRFLSQPAVQREVGGAIGTAAVKELSTGVGKPYMQGITIAAGVGAASLLALAVMYAVKK